MTEHVLVPLDGSPQSQRAFDYALTLPDVRLTLLTVINPFDVDAERPGYQSPLGKAGVPAYSQEWYQRFRDEAVERQQADVETAEEAGVETAGDVVFGQAARQIVGYAEDHDVDHIVLGTHGRRNLSRVLLGSVAESVVRRAPSRVTVVR
ncbi:universal stress protein [Halomarina oriensis]|uniref:Universal stress protein n=1 Tax=Halomarina oriensis TaxID=671145 RepID=A0A6B0GH49_9EURY|nr:universal stress protein [Halomarina oriensis]MWG33091.1 universal stress protein [Halomarina oriensis]